MLSPKKAIDVINARFGRHPGYRALHAKGIVCRGTFTASPEAPGLTKAAHLQGEPVDVTVRWSNGTGTPGIPDYVPDVRGMSVKFHLADGSSTDLVAQTLPRFPVATPEAFIELVAASDRAPLSRARFLWFALRHPSALAPLRERAPILRAPSSYAALTYFPIHAYRWVAADGSSRYVRYRLVPELDLPSPGPGEAKARGRDYLADDLRERLAAGAVRYRLVVQVAADGDAVDDPRSVWPADRQTVDVGTLEVTTVDDAAEGPDRVLVFDPTRVVDGIELSDDPILRYRPLAYSESVARRSE